MAGTGGAAGPELAPGFDELVPVEAFFDSYVAALEGVGAAAVHQPHDCAGPAHRQQAGLAREAAEAEHYAALMDAVEFDLHLGSTDETQGDNLGGAISFNVADLAGLLEEPIEPIVPSGGSALGGSGTRASATGGEALDAAVAAAQYGTPPTPIVQSGYVSADASHAQASHAPNQEGSVHSHGRSDGAHQAATSQPQGKPKRRRVRSEHQQEQNKLAQKRYRERKKQKAAVLETTVEELAGRAEELARIREQNAGLQSTKAQLESELLEKEAQIRRLNEELEGSKQAGQPGESSGVSASVSTSDLKGLWHAKMDEMRNVYEFNGLRGAKPTGEGVPEEVLGTMSMLVDEVVGVVRRLTRVEGLDINELVNADPHGCDHLCDEQTKEIWTRVAAQCELSEGQVAKVRVLRAEHLRKLEAIYNARQKLNLQAISVLLPAGMGSGSSGSGGGCMAGLFSRSRSNDKTKRALEELKENLREEQRLASELELIVLNRLLSPLQAVSFMLEAYPCHCDCLALLNGAFQVYCGGGT